MQFMRTVIRERVRRNRAEASSGRASTSQANLARGKLNQRLRTRPARASSSAVLLISGSLDEDVSPSEQRLGHEIDTAIDSIELNDLARGELNQQSGVDGCDARTSSGPIETARSEYGKIDRADKPSWMISKYSKLLVLRPGFIDAENLLADVNPYLYEISSPNSPHPMEGEYDPHHLRVLPDQDAIEVKTKSETRHPLLLVLSSWSNKQGEQRK